jgi:purine nucleosidase
MSGSIPGATPLGFLVLFSFLVFSQAQTPPTASTRPEKIIIDTDIGDDIDDAFAVALALRSPEVQILGISTTFGDVETRAKLLDRLLGEAGREDIPVAVGIHDPRIQTSFSQRAYAEGGRFARKSHPQAVDFILDQIRKNPGRVTLVTIGALGNVGAVIDKEPQTFRQLRRVVMMGGSIYRGYGDLGYSKPHGPDAEWNIKLDVASARKLLASGVPVFMMPLDSTQLKLDEVKRTILFEAATPLTDALTLLYHEWGQETPTLFDAMTIAFVDKPGLCPVTPMHIVVDDKGFTRPQAGAPNAEVCLDSDPEMFFRFYIPRVIEK